MAVCRLPQRKTMPFEDLIEKAFAPVVRRSTRGDSRCGTRRRRCRRDARRADRRGGPDRAGSGRPAARHVVRSRIPYQGDLHHHAHSAIRRSRPDRAGRSLHERHSGSAPIRHEGRRTPADLPPMPVTQHASACGRAALYLWPGPADPARFRTSAPMTSGISGLFGQQLHTAGNRHRAAVGERSDRPGTGVRIDIPA